MNFPGPHTRESRTPHSIESSRGNDARVGERQDAAGRDSGKRGAREIGTPRDQIRRTLDLVVKSAIALPGDRRLAGRIERPGLDDKWLDSFGRGADEPVGHEKPVVAGEGRVGNVEFPFRCHRTESKRGESGSVKGASEKSGIPSSWADQVLFTRSMRVNRICREMKPNSWSPRIKSVRCPKIARSRRHALPAEDIRSGLLQVAPVVEDNGCKEVSGDIIKGDEELVLLAVQESCTPRKDSNSTQGKPPPRGRSSPGGRRL